MPKTPERIIVDPSGRSMDIDILDSRDDASIVCYTTLDGATEVTLPLTITDVTSFFLTASGAYKLSAQVAGREIAGDAAVAPIECRYGIPVRVTPRVSTVGELLDIAAGAPAVTAALTSYDPTSSGLSGTDVQAAVDEVAAGLTPASSDVTYDHTVSGLSATTVKGALDELAALIAAL